MNIKKVYQYTINGEYVQGFNTIKAAAETVGGTREEIGHAANGKTLLGCGFRWSFSCNDCLPPLSSFDKYNIVKGEVWKKIQGYSRYFVSNMGRIRSTTYVSRGNKDKVEYGKVYKLSTDNFGYKMIALIDDNGNRVLNRVHHLVAETFIPNPDNLPMINHKDQNPGNNRVENLEWCTAQYNATYADAHKKRNMNLKRWYVQMYLDGSIKKVHRGLDNAAKEVNGSKQCVSNCCCGLNGSYRGYKWKRLKDFPQDKQKRLIKTYYDKDKMQTTQM